MFRLLGGIIIVFSSFMYFRIKTEEIKMKITLADGLISGFVALEEQVCGLCLPIGRALYNASYLSGRANAVFCKAADFDGGGFDRFSQALQKEKEFSDLVLPYVSGITAVEEEERRCSFSLIRARLEEKRNTLIKELERLGRLYGVIGIPLGVLIVILLY